MSDHDHEVPGHDHHDCCGGATRRGVLGAGLAVGAGAFLSQIVSGEVKAAPSDATLSALARAGSSAPILLKGGIVLSMDPKVGNFEKGDVLIRNGKIKAVGPKIDAHALEIDARGMIVMPGFIDTHHHQYETALRSILADGLLSSTEDMPVSYISLIQGVYTPLYTPDDAYMSVLVASLSQLNNGTTTTVDTSQVNNSPEHTDAMVKALRDSGRRALFAYSGGVGPDAKFPQDIVRVKEQYFSSKDQLLTLGLGTGTDQTLWALARSIDVPIISHIVGPFGSEPGLMAAYKAGAMGPDNEYIHCTELSDDMWKAIADTGGKVSIGPAIEMQMRHGMPPFLKALSLKVPLSLSVDVECNMTADMFTIMRSAFTLQRALVNQKRLNGQTRTQPLLTCNDTIKLATLGGADCAHLADKVGSLTPGKEADVILLNANLINVFPLNNAPGAVVTLMDTSNVDTVFVAGKLKKWRGRLVDVDIGALRRRIDASRDSLLAKAGLSLDLFGSCCQAKGALD
ncbi:amidohydrolase family protein [Hansschlegelia zhihuaiae]|uniref:Amidohydrolase n=1 Tax=Hansschlegelia zhihuaiae TaxID=405005 RepID=A0A4Q0MNF8_9HYPH|nr:amidohydrolase family protein [Hansschlegelia zhihuaiae]RXF75294.1 amidohydrolase [Hansschlegelia zhihuaiae]